TRCSPPQCCFDDSVSCLRGLVALFCLLVPSAGSRLPGGERCICNNSAKKTPLTRRVSPSACAARRGPPPPCGGSPLPSPCATTGRRPAGASYLSPSTPPRACGYLPRAAPPASPVCPCVPGSGSGLTCPS